MSAARPGKPMVIGVVGGSGAGKTTVVRAIVEALGPDRVVQLAEDAYYREYSHFSEAERRAINWDHPDAIETDLLVRHIGELIAGKTISQPVYDFAAYARRAE